MSNNPKKSSKTTGQDSKTQETTNKQGQGQGAGKSADQGTTGSNVNQAWRAAENPAMENQGTTGQQADSAKADRSRYGRESWNEFSRRSSPATTAQNQTNPSGGQGRQSLGGQSRNPYDQGRPTQEWERAQEQEWSSGSYRGGARSEGQGGQRSREGRFQTGFRGQEQLGGGYGPDTGFNRTHDREAWSQRSREDYTQGDYDYGRGSSRFGATRENREFGQSRGQYGPEEFRGSASVERGRGRGERGERSFGDREQARGMDYDAEAGNRETTGDYRYGGSPNEERGYQGYMGPDYPRFNRPEDVREWDRDFRREFERQRGGEEGRGGGRDRDYEYREDYGQRGNFDRDASQSWRRESSGRYGETDRWSSSPRRSESDSDREGRDWARDQISGGYNAGDYGEQDWRRGRERDDDRGYRRSRRDWEND